MHKSVVAQLVFAPFLFARDLGSVGFVLNPNPFLSYLLFRDICKAQAERSVVLI